MIKDKTTWYAQQSPPVKELHELLAKHPVRIEEYEDGRSETYGGMIASVTIRKLRIVLDGKVVRDNMDMPRDVWNVLRGIIIGMNYAAAK